MKGCTQESWSLLPLPQQLPLSRVVLRNCPTLQRLCQTSPAVCPGLGLTVCPPSPGHRASAWLERERAFSLFAACLTIYFRDSREAQPFCPGCSGERSLPLLLGLVPLRANKSPLPPLPGGGPETAQTLIQAEAGSTLPRESAPNREREKERKRGRQRVQVACSSH